MKYVAPKEAEIARRQQENVGELRVPLRQKHQGAATLRRMAERGEISYAFDARVEDGEWVVNYVRLREPRDPMPRMVALAAACLAVPAGLAGAIYHARHVILAALTVVGGGLVLAPIAMFVYTMMSRRGAGHCPGAWHR